MRADHRRSLGTALATLALVVAGARQSASTFTPMLWRAEDLGRAAQSVALGAPHAGRLLALGAVGAFGSRLGAPRQLPWAFAALGLCAAALAWGVGPAATMAVRLGEGVALAAVVLGQRVLVNGCVAADTARNLNAQVVAAEAAGMLLGPAVAGLLVAARGPTAVTWTLAATWSALTVGVALAARIWPAPFGAEGPEQGRLTAQPQAAPGKPSAASKLAAAQVGTAAAVATAPHHAAAAACQRTVHLVMAAHGLEFVGLGLWLSSWAPLAAADLGWTGREVGLSMSVAAGATMVSAPLMARLGRWAPQARCLAGLALLALQPLACAFTGQGTGVALFAVFAVGGMGGGLYFAAVHELLGRHVPLAQLRRTYARLGVVTAAGQATGSLVTPYAAAWLGTRGPLWLDAAALGLAMAVMARVARQPGLLRA